MFASPDQHRNEWPQTPEPRNGSLVAGAVLGAAGILLGSFGKEFGLPVLNLVAVAFGITGIALGMSGYQRTRPAQPSAKRPARWALLGIALPAGAVGQSISEVLTAFGAS